MYFSFFWCISLGSTDSCYIIFLTFAKLTAFVCIDQDVTSLSWQTSKPVFVNEKNYTSEMALLGSTVEDSVVIPDPLPSTIPSASQPALAPGSRGVSASTVNASSVEQTPNRTHLWPGGPLGRLHALRASDSFNDDMGVFSPIIDVSSVEKWADSEGFNNKDHLVVDKKPSSLLFPSSSKGYSFGDDGNKEHPIFDWKASSTSKQVCVSSSSKCYYYFYKSLS